MAAPDGPNLLALPPSVLASRSLAALRDVRAYVDPDAVWVLGPGREPQAYARARQVFDDPVVHPPLGDRTEPIQRHDLGDASFLSVQRASALADPDVSHHLSHALDDEAVSGLVCDDVTTTVRPTALETRLECAPELAAGLPAGRTTTVLTGGVPAGYDEVWHLASETGAVLGVGEEFGRIRESANEGDEPDEYDQQTPESVSVRVRGGGPVDGYGTADSLSTLALDSAPDEGGAVETLSADAFGLEAVSGVGPKTARRLTDNGVTSREELLDTPIATLSALPGIGQRRARGMHHHATVLETGEPRRLTDEALPGEGWPKSPLCLDVETDGLSPTIIWQIGVYDPAADEYRAFVERSEPTAPGPVLEAFCDWLFGVHPDRALLTWNGWRFDYRHLGAFVARHVPHYVETWESVPKLDLYGWAVRDKNAVLPARTNRLEDVAGALGYENAGTGLDGAATAAAYQRFIRTGDELAWDRHEAYCEDDCRALWHVYECLRDAEVVSSASAESSPRAARTTSRNHDSAEGASAEGASATDEPSKNETTKRKAAKRPTTGGTQTGLGDF